LKCAAESGTPCPKCGVEVTAESRRQVFAKYCVFCGLSNPERTLNCGECGSQTHWANVEECSRYHEELKRSFLRKLVVGALFIGFGLLGILGLFGALLKIRLPINLITLWFVGAAASMGRGLVLILRVRAMRKRLQGSVDWLSN